MRLQGSEDCPDERRPSTSICMQKDWIPGHFGAEGGQRAVLVQFEGEGDRRQSDGGEGRGPGAATVRHGRLLVGARRLGLRWLLVRRCRRATVRPREVAAAGKLPACRYRVARARSPAPPASQTTLSAPCALPGPSAALVLWFTGVHRCCRYRRRRVRRARCPSRERYGRRRGSEASTWAEARTCSSHRTRSFTTRCTTSCAAAASPPLRHGAAQAATRWCLGAAV